MSRMKATFGLVSAMYVKFCSGPTPMYAPPGVAVFERPCETWRYDVSLEIVLSEKNGPSGSESEVTRSANGNGASAAAAEALGAAVTEAGADGARAIDSAARGSAGPLEGVFPQAASKATRARAGARRIMFSRA